MACEQPHQTFLPRLAGIVQRRVAVVGGAVQGGAVLQQQEHHPFVTVRQAVTTVRIRMVHGGAVLQQQARHGFVAVLTQ